MSEETEFESVGSENWKFVRLGAQQLASRRLQNRYDAVKQGAQRFRDQADTLVKDAIKKPPDHLSGFGVVADAVAAACGIVLPELEVADEMVEALKGAYEAAKASAELVEKANQEVVANSLEEATGYLQELTKKYAEDVEEKALAVEKAAEDAVGAALDSYIKQNPQPLNPGDDELCKNLCDAIGIKDPVPDAIENEVWDEVFPPFKKQVLVIAAQIHFFKEMDNDAERLNFLMDEAEKGNDPDDLLSLIGADRSYWDSFLSVFRSDGRLAAGAALEQHLLHP